MAIATQDTVLWRLHVGLFFAGVCSANTANVVAELGIGAYLHALAIVGDFQMTLADFDFHFTLWHGISAYQWLLGFVIRADNNDVFECWEFFFVIDVHAWGVGLGVLRGWSQFDEDVFTLFLSQNDQNFLVLFLVAAAAALTLLLFGITDHDGNLFIGVFVLVVVVWSGTAGVR